MVAQSNVEELIRKTKQYEYTDGLFDLAMAVVWMSMGMISWFVFDMARVWFHFIAWLMNVFGYWARWVSMLVVLLPALLACGAFVLITFVRKRWLWRDSGWVKPLRLVTPRRVPLISTAIMLGSILLGFTLYHFGTVGSLFALQMLVIGTSWTTGYSLVALGRHVGLPRYIWLGMIGGLAPTPALFLNLSFGQTCLALGLWWSLVLAVSGTVTLQRRMRSTQAVPGDR